jgi:hypothetical protein
MKDKSARASDKKSDAAIQALKEATCPIPSVKPVTFLQPTAQLQYTPSDYTADMGHAHSRVKLCFEEFA